MDFWKFGLVFETLVVMHSLSLYNLGELAGEEGFFFGLATAPAHVEDRLDDAWVQFAEEGPCDDSKSAHSPEPADALMASATGDGGSQQAPAPTKEPAKIKKRKTVKIAMEAMIRGIEKYLVEEEESTTVVECSHNIAAWHNVPHP